MLKEKIIRLLKKLPKKYISLPELENFLGIKRAILKVTLTRLVKQDELQKIGRGFYCLPDAQPDLWQIALEIDPAAYLSFESALNFYGMLSQVPAVITLATPARSRKIKLLNQVAEYSHFKKDLWFGYQIAKQTKIASPEKAFLDELYFISLGKRSLPLKELDLHNLNLKLIQKWAKRFPPATQKLAKELCQKNRLG
jgi:predicted transcriptional regulator of viral defense system